MNDSLLTADGLIINSTASTPIRCVSCAGGLYSNPGLFNLIQCCKRFATASASTKIVFPGRYFVEMAPLTHYTLWHNTELNSGMDSLL